MSVDNDQETAVQTLEGGALWRLWLGLGAGLLGCLLLSLCLPFDRYIAWQQSAGTQMFHSRWIYERLNFDPSPIDVAIIGSSRLESGMSPSVLAQTLSDRLGRDIAVANLSIVMPGRDFADTITRELLATHPEVQLILLSDDGEITNSHPMFKQTASAAQLLHAPVLVNAHFFTNLLALPFRNIANVAQQMHPAWFGVADIFVASDYPGTGLDRTLGYRTADGTLVNGEQTMASAALLAMSRDAVARQRAGLALLRPLPDRYRLAIDRHYLASIARRARRADVSLAFLSIPLYGPLQATGDRRAYAPFGPVLALDDLAQHPELYQSAAHLNRKGAVRASRAAAQAIAPLLVGTKGEERAPGQGRGRS
ncbi:hypothetical protein [Sphingobium sp. D43FB]|uniref:hypothetical protein n=1 Tax=Sphingobium sp. D43FB TaxID=2017595 RepID=UPI000BB56D9A|nr:hypothetical protein [Sphingobium sp. D43FB]PBN41699.1 hypothetical protein SxD43FB_20310 [Sphingobium sp. D43FB]